MLTRGRVWNWLDADSASDAPSRPSSTLPDSASVAVFLTVAVSYSGDQSTLDGETQALVRKRRRQVTVGVMDQVIDPDSGTRSVTCPVIARAGGTKSGSESPGNTAAGFSDAVQGTSRSLALAPMIEVAVAVAVEFAGDGVKVVVADVEAAAGAEAAFVAGYRYSVPESVACASSRVHSYGTKNSRVGSTANSAESGQVDGVALSTGVHASDEVNFERETVDSQDGNEPAGTLPEMVMLSVNDAIFAIVVVSCV